jgi:hypothetical protein
MTPDDVTVAERLERNRLSLSSGAGSAAEVVAGLCGLQAQELPAARLAVRARSSGLTDAAVERERVEDRSFIRTWAMRGTLHLVPSADWEWLRSLTGAASIRSNARRSAELGLDEQTYRRALEITQLALAGGGSLSREEWKDALTGHGVDASGQRAPYLLARASAEGLICEGPVCSGKPTYVLLDEWLGPRPPAPADRTEALNRLVHRYLAAYGPAAAEDLAAWSGLGVRECREAFFDAQPELVELPAGSRRLWSANSRPAASPKAGTRLLPAFDTFLLGYRDRALHLDPRHATKVNAGGGIVKPVVLVDGRAQGTWRLRRRGTERAVVGVTPFENNELPGDGIEAEVADIARFLGLAVEPA